MLMWGTVLGFPRLARREACQMRCLNMPEAYSYYSHYEALTWSFIREQIGQDLREHYQVPERIAAQIARTNFGISCGRRQLLVAA